MSLDDLDALDHLAKLLVMFNGEVPSQDTLNVLLTYLRSKLVHSWPE